MPSDQNSVLASLSDLVPVTPNDSADLPGGTCRAIYLTVDGALAVVTGKGTTRTYASGTFPIQTIIPLRWQRVKATGTTATVFVGY